MTCKGRPNPTTRHITSDLSKEEIAARWEARLAEKTVRNENGCRLWIGPVNAQGYGQTSAFGRLKMVHRFTYEVVYDMKIHPKLVVCHQCDNPGCCNPDHLWIGTEKQNMQDAAAKRRWSRQHQTHCKHGHEFSPENTHIKIQRGKPCRVCKMCERLRWQRGLADGSALERQRRYKARLRAQKLTG